jgi:hypothetical protein
MSEEETALYERTVDALRACLFVLDQLHVYGVMRQAKLLLLDHDGLAECAVCGGSCRDVDPDTGARIPCEQCMGQGTVKKGSPAAIEG